MNRLIEHHSANPKQEVKGTEVFVGGLARTTTENKIHEVFSSCGEILEIRLIKDQKGTPKGFCFVRFATKYAADKALKEKSGYVLDGKKIGVRPSTEQDTLFLGNLNKGWSAEEFESIVRQVFPDVVSVELASTGDVQPGQKQRNRGFAFVKFSSHAAAARAFRVGSQSDFLIGGKLHPSVQWAEEEPEVDPNELAQIKVAFVRNIPTGADEDYLKMLFQPFGNVEKVTLSRKGNSAIGFIYFDNRSGVDNSIRVLNEQTVQGPMGGPSWKLQIEVARPMDKNRKRAREDPKSTLSSEIESRSKLLKDDPNVEIAGAPKSIAQPEMNYSDPYEAAVVALPAVVKERLLRIMRLGIATRYDIDVENLTTLKVLPESAAISVLDQFMLSGADMQNKGGYLASLISKVDKLGLKQFASMPRIEDVALRVPETDSFSARVRLPVLDSYATRIPLPIPRDDVYTRYSSAYLDSLVSDRITTKRMVEASSTLQATPLLSGRVTTRRMEEASPGFPGSPPLLSGGLTTRRMDDASSNLRTTSLLSGQILTRREEPSPPFQTTWSASPANERVGLHAHNTASSDQHTRPRIRFDPFTGEPYKFDPFTGEPIVPESSSSFRSLY